MRVTSALAGNGIQSELWRNVGVICNADVLVLLGSGREEGVVLSAGSLTKLVL